MTENDTSTTGSDRTLGELTYSEIVEMAREEVVNENGEGDWRNVDVRLTFEDEHGFVWTWYRLLDSEDIDWDEPVDGEAQPAGDRDE